MRVLFVLLGLAVFAHAEWGRDINPGMGAQLQRSVEDELVRLKKAAAADRPALIAAIVERHGDKRIEALKRYRNPEFKELFLALLDHADWHVQHRALFVLEYFGDAAVIDRAWPLLRHPQRRLREKAAITCIKLWDGRTPPAPVADLLKTEQDFHVRRCLDALQRRIAGTLVVDRVFQEYVRTYPTGLMATPFLSGMDQAAKVAPGFVAKKISRQGNAGREVAERWTTPLLGYGEEEVEGVSLQPFANLRQGGKVYHTGTDVGACLDGAGLYAAAAGSVVLVHAGSDMGTLLVVQHQLGAGAKVNAVYMHGGDTVFVRAGDAVECGQLLGTMGLGFSLENGGHFAHLHYGLYPGAFSLTHNYGYKQVRDGLADWYDPAPFLKRWNERSRPLLPELRPLERALERTGQLAARGDYARAHAAARKTRNSAEPGSEVHVDAVYLLGLLEQVPGNALARATRIRDGGYPKEAARQLKELALRCKGIAGVDQLKETLAAWEKDPLFVKALKGEARLESTLRRAEKAKDRAKTRTLWQRLLADYGDTCLRPRIEERLR